MPAARALAQLAAGRADGTYARHAEARGRKRRRRSATRALNPINRRGSRLAAEVTVHITVPERRRAANAVFDHLDASGQSGIELTADYYRNIPNDRLCTTETAPEGSLDLGQLTSDREELQAVGRAADPAPSHDLVHLAALLRFIASKVLP